MQNPDHDAHQPDMPAAPCGQDLHAAQEAGAKTIDRQTLDWHDGDMPYSQEFGDHFYCRTDGRLECGHVFLAGNGLPDRWQAAISSPGDGAPFCIGELGFGTGLNFCETWRQWTALRAALPTGVDRPGGRLDFTSFELFPMERGAIDRALSRWPQIDAERRALLAAWPDAPSGRVVIDLDPQTRLTVVCGPALAGVSAAEAGFDAWFLDGFAPSRNPDMWSVDLMQALFDRTKAGGSFATYAAAGFVRRNLAAAGFVVERRPGFAGKREMLCGHRP